MSKQEAATFECAANLNGEPVVAVSITLQGGATRVLKQGETRKTSDPLEIEIWRGALGVEEVKSKSKSKSKSSNSSSPKSQSSTSKSPSTSTTHGGND